jgi:sulfur-carrier protein
MPITVRVPGSLKDWLEGREEASCQGKTLRECIDNLESRFPGIQNRLVDEEGEIGPVLIFLNGENIAKREGLTTEIHDGDEIGIIPLAAGG